MKNGLKILMLLIFLGITGAATWLVQAQYFSQYSDTEADFNETNTPTKEIISSSLPSIPEPIIEGRIQWSRYWEDMTPLETAVYVENFSTLKGPARVGIQPGHWQLETVPEELEGLRQSTGAIGGEYTEQETVLKIAQEVKLLLEAEGVVVDLLPATVPVDYVADAFISIHADGSTSNTVSGYKISGPRRDFSGKAEALVETLYESYGVNTGLRQDGNITRRMSSYYAFNWRRYQHAIHPMTPGVIVETGFMTNPDDRALLVDSYERPAKGITSGIITFLRVQNRL